MYFLLLMHSFSDLIITLFLIVGFSTLDAFRSGAYIRRHHHGSTLGAATSRPSLCILHLFYSIDCVIAANTRYLALASPVYHSVLPMLSTRPSLAMDMFVDLRTQS